MDAFKSINKSSIYYCHNDQSLIQLILYKILYEVDYMQVTNSTQYTLKQTRLPGNIIISKNLWIR